MSSPPLPLDPPRGVLDLPDERQLVFRCAVVVVVLTFVLVFAGALVTSTNSGMAFRTWPDADGALLWPEHPTLSGVLEHSHRLLGAATGIAAILLLVLIHRFDRRPAMYRLGALLLVSIVVQGVLGGYRVLLNDHFPTLFPILHGSLAYVVFALGGYVAFRASTGWLTRAVEEPRAVHRARRLAWIALVVMYVQILLGVVLRHTDSSHAKWAHVGFAAVTALVALIAASYAAGRFRGIVGFVRLHRIYMLVLLAQVVLGLVTLLVRRPKHLADTHLLGKATTVSVHVLCGGVLLVLTALLLARTRRNLVPRGAA